MEDKSDSVQAIKDRMDKKRELQKMEDHNRRAKAQREYQKNLLDDAAFKQASAVDNSTDIKSLACPLDPIEAIRRLRKNSREGTTFIHKDFDRLFRIQKANLIAVLGYTGGGKTTTGANIAACLIENDKRVAIISNEEPGDKYQAEIVCLLAGVNSYAMKEKPNPNEVSAYKKSTSDLKDSHLKVYDSSSTLGGSQNATSVLKMIELLNALDEPERPHVVIVDYLQNIITSGVGASMSAGDHYSMLDSFCINLKNLANDLDLCVIIMAQMHSDDKKKGEAADAKVIMGGSVLRNSMRVIEVRSNKDTHSTEFRISKNRDGNGLGRVTLTWKNGRYVTRDETYEGSVAMTNAINNIYSPEEDKDVV